MSINVVDQLENTWEDSGIAPDIFGFRYREIKESNLNKMLANLQSCCMCIGETEPYYEVRAAVQNMADAPRIWLKDADTVISDTATYRRVYVPDDKCVRVVFCDDALFKQVIVKLKRVVIRFSMFHRVDGNLVGLKDFIERGG